VNDEGGSGSCEIEEWVDTTEFTNVKVAGLGNCLYLVRERKTGVHQRRSWDCEQTGQFYILASCCL